MARCGHEAILVFQARHTGIDVHRRCRQVSIVTAFRSVTHGTCALDGKHPPGSVYAKECPVLNAAERSARSQRAAATRWKGRGASTAPPQASDRVK